MSNFIIFPFSKVHIDTNQLCISLWGSDFVDSPLVGYQLAIYDSAIEVLGSPELVTRRLFDVLQRTAAIQLAEKKGFSCWRVTFLWLRWKYGRDQLANRIVTSAIKEL